MLSSQNLPYVLPQSHTGPDTSLPFCLVDQEPVSLECTTTHPHPLELMCVVYFLSKSRVKLHLTSVTLFLFVCRVCVLLLVFACVLCYNEREALRNGNHTWGAYGTGTPGSLVWVYRERRPHLTAL
jgi:hypothetical protein